MVFFQKPKQLALLFQMRSLILRRECPTVQELSPEQQWTLLKATIKCIAAAACIKPSSPKAKLYQVPLQRQFTHDSRQRSVPPACTMDIESNDIVYLNLESMIVFPVKCVTLDGSGSLAPNLIPEFHDSNTAVTKFRTQLSRSHGTFRSLNH
ncbi:hypothetical protein CBL_05901 [Carabus blaptoides fortunei]